MIAAKISELGLKYDSRSKVTVAEAETLERYIRLKDYDGNFKAVVALNLMQATEMLSAVIMDFPDLARLKDHIQFKLLYEEIKDGQFWSKFAHHSGWYDMHKIEPAMPNSV